MIKFLPVLIIISAMIGCDRILEDTEYATGFSEQRFRQVTIGMSEKDVLAILGNPFTVTTQAWVEIWSYYPVKKSPSQTNRSVLTTRLNFDVPATATELSFDPAGIVTNVIGEFLRDATNGISGKEAEIRWGKPQELFSRPFARVYHYTRSAGGGTYKLREVYIDANERVLSIIAEIYYD